MTVIRVSPALSAKIREEALRGKNAIFSVTSGDTATPKDTIALVLESDADALPKQFRANVATSRMRPPTHSPVTTWRPGSASHGM